jgi:hypothetical protein
VTGGRRAAPRARSGLAGAAVLVGVIVLVLFYRPGDDDPATGPQPTPTSTPTSVAPPASPSEEAFCAEFRRLAAAQSEYAAAPDARAIELLRDAADRLVEVGVPETMTLPARSGYFTVIDGVYGSLGLSIEPAAVGALDEPVDGADAAFSSYLIQFCPA